MKYIFLFLMISGFSSFSQTGEGHIRYNITYSSDNEEYQMTLSMMTDAYLEVYYSGEKSSVTNNMGFSSITVVSDETKDSVLILTELLDDKYAIFTNNDSVKSDENKDPAPLIFDKKEKRTILGKKCKKAYVQDEDGSTITYWYTTSIKMDGLSQHTFRDDVPGVILGCEEMTPEMTVYYEAVQLNTDPPAYSLLEISVPDGYQLLTMEEFEALGK